MKENEAKDMATTQGTGSTNRAGRPQGLRLTTIIPEEVHTALCQAAAEDRRTLSAFTAGILEEWARKSAATEKTEGA